MTRRHQVEDRLTRLIRLAYREGWEDRARCDGEFADCVHYSGALSDHWEESEARQLANKVRGELAAVRAAREGGEKDG